MRRAVPPAAGRRTDCARSTHHARHRNPHQVLHLPIYGKRIPSGLESEYNGAFPVYTKEQRDELFARAADKPFDEVTAFIPGAAGGIDPKMFSPEATYAPVSTDIGS